MVSVQLPSALCDTTGLRTSRERLHVVVVHGHSSRVSCKRSYISSQDCQDDPVHFCCDVLI